MERNYLTYPCKVMNITQGYTGNYSHGPHNTGSPKDYPWDEACSDSGRSAMYCPCDEIKITRIYGVGSRGTNTIWLTSTSEVFFADGTSGYFTMLVTHPNDDDVKDLKVGQTFKRGQFICYEGTDGNATGNHFHFSAGKGTGGSWRENSNGKWVLTCSGGTYKPEALFYVDKDFTTIKNAKGLSFKALPDVSVGTIDVKKPAQIKNIKATPSSTSIKLSWNKVSDATGYYVFFYNATTKKYTSIGSTKSTSYNVKNLTVGTNYKLAVQAYKTVGGKNYWGKVSDIVAVKTKYVVGSYKVDEKLLRVRPTASTNKDYKKFNQLTSSARKKILALNNNNPADGYVKGLTFTVTLVKGNWGKTPSGWVCLDYCTKI